MLIGQRALGGDLLEQGGDVDAGGGEALQLGGERWPVGIGGKPEGRGPTAEDQRECRARDQEVSVADATIGGSRPEEGRAASRRSVKMAMAFRAAGSLAPSRPSCHEGLWRALVAVPAVIGSLLLLMVLFGWLGLWEALVLLGWLASGAVVFTPVGERIAAWVSCGFHRPSTAQAVELAPLWETALRQSGTAAGDVDLYVQLSRQANAYAAGGRSVAVTTGVLREYLAHRLTEDQLVAVLVHELGHHVTRATRFALVAVWLAALWRLAARLLIGLTLASCGRQPRRLLAAVVSAGVVVAVAQAVSQQSWLVAGVLGGVALLAVLCPLADAALARRAELAADRFAANHGLALPLAGALRTLDGDHHAVRSWFRRLFTSHPAVDRRIDALLASQ